MPRACPAAFGQMIELFRRSRVLEELRTLPKVSLADRAVVRGLRMLSEKTLAYLEGLCHASAMIWTEGGLNFHYTAYRNSAHSHVPEEWRSAFHECGCVEFNDATTINFEI